MKPPEYPARPPDCLSCCSHGVSGHNHPWYSISVPHTAAEICKKTIHRHYNARNAPNTTKQTNPRWRIASKFAAIQ